MHHLSAPLFNTLLPYFVCRLVSEFVKFKYVVGDVGARVVVFFVVVVQDRNAIEGVAELLAVYYNLHAVVWLWPFFISSFLAVLFLVVVVVVFLFVSVGVVVVLCCLL